MLEALQEINKGTIEIVVYSGDNVSSDTIFSKVKERFEIAFPDTHSITFVHLKYRSVIEAERYTFLFCFFFKINFIEFIDRRYPRLTMIGQSIGSILLALEGLLRCPPDIYFGIPISDILIES